MMQEDNETRYDDFTLDDWIVFIQEKVECSENEEEKDKYEKVLRSLKNIKDVGYVVDDNIFISVNRINRAFSNIFNSWEYYTIDNNGSLILYNDIVYLELYSDGKETYCNLGLGYQTQPEIAAEIALVLKDIFREKVSVISDVFYFNDLDNSFIWGIDDIKNHINRIHGFKKITPIVVYDETNAGNC